MASRPRFAFAVAVVVAILVVGGGCAPGGGAAAPTDLRAALTSFDTIELTWTTPAGQDGVQLQGRLAGGAWEAIGDAPADAIGLVISLSADAPEAADFGFRIRGVKGGAVSEWSGETTVHRGVRPATGLVVTGGSGPPPVIGVHWTAGSTQADAIRVERRIIPHGDTPGPWVAIPGVPVGVTFAEDTVEAWLDGAVVECRVTYVKGSEESTPAQGSSDAAPPLAPVGLVATPAGPLSVRLDWTARSAYATKQVVIRQARLAPGQSEVATLGPEVNGWVDTVPETGVYLYWISARVGDAVNVTNYVADSAPVVGFTTLPGMTLSTSTLVAPGGTKAVRDAAGRFATAAASMYTVSAWREVDGGWEAHETVRATYPDLSGPGLLLRPDGGLELLYRLLFPFPTTFNREWFDGAWHAESVSDLQPTDAVAGPGGELRIVECQSGILRYATNASGAWVVETIPVGEIAVRCAVTTGPGGDVRIAWTSPRPGPPGQESSPTSSDLHLVRPGPGGWVDETAPLGAEAVALDPRVLRIHAPSVDRTVVIFQGFTALSAGTDFSAVTRDAGTWGAPVSLGFRQFNGSEESFTSATSPDGARVAVAWNGFLTGGCCSPATLAILGVDGAWTSTSLYDTQAWLASGFSPQGKLWVLELSPIWHQGILYEEP